MNETATRIKEWTDEPRLPQVLDYRYGIQLKDAQPVGGVLKLSTNQGTFALKRVRDREEKRWQLVEELSRHVERTGEIKIPVPQTTRQGQRTFAGFKRSYVLLPWIEGEHRSWDREGWRRVAGQLARFHLASKGFVAPSSLRGLSHVGEWRKIWTRMEQQVEMFKLAADLGDEFAPVDRLWMTQCSFAEGMLETALRYLEKVGGDTVVEQTRRAGEACHLNIHRKNVLWQGKTPHLIDWNCTVLDVRTRDLARYLLYTYGRTGGLEAVTSSLSSYQEYAPLEEVEYALIYSQLLFPHLLMRSLHNIYQERKIPGHLAKGHLSAAINQEEGKLPLLRQFPQAVKQEFGVTIPEVDWLRPKRDPGTE
ncbi:phosphotransferase [Desmospora profundinema]|uniref:CotS family spore coat protein n=1 Tax=Desmospora profundinema TaxID=1571184 RepID=A0ABU1IN91_9BACL|nr:phosphotransferase [Desmospora profundinema]MDR6226246.1 CotS family spore coat protein [Desmospora profundinema]